MTRALLTTAVLAFASSVATADTITVCLDGSCEYSDIQEAINAASDGDVIEIAAGTYYPAATIDTLGKAVTLRGVAGKGKDGAPTSIIDGQDSIRVLICENGEGPGTVFENLLITGGYTKGTGGGMLNNGSSSPTLTGCAFTSNSADNYGGGMNNSSSSPILENCTFTGNSAVSGGGGMYNRNNSNPTLIDCTFEGNSAEDYGGGMYNYDSSSPTLSDCTFTDNSVSYGGGMYNVSNSPTLEDCTFEGNSAGTYGGGMYNRYDSSPTLTGCTFEGNSAGSGGGMYNYGSSPTLTNCTFSYNLADNGGGMYNVSNSPTLEDCTFEGNSAGTYGGGMYNFAGSLTLTDCTFEGNSANHGGGMYNSNSSGPTLTGTTLCGNSPDQVLGSWIDNGGNCLVSLCYDSDGDGRPDCAANETEDYLEVPSDYPTIELALLVAAEGATIEVAAGTFMPAITLDTNGKSLTLRGAIDGEGNPTTIIDGQDSIRVLLCTSGEADDTVFENLLITGGNGGMYINNSNPTLINCTFEGNSASDRGGGMYNINSSSLTLIDCAFQENSAVYGGGMYNFESSPTLENCTFTNNSAYGGGMYNSASNSPTLTDCTFTECCQVYPPNSFFDNGGNDYDSWCDECRADVNCNDEVNSADLGLILSAWNTTEAQYDIDGDGVVGGGDLGMLLGSWGVCP